MWLPGAVNRWSETRRSGWHDPRGRSSPNHQRLLPGYYRQSELPPFSPSKSDNLFLNVILWHFPSIPPPQFNYIRPHMTLLMTGSHSLAELRDAICCVSDLQVCGEFSNTPDMAPDFISKVGRRALRLCKYLSIQAHKTNCFSVSGSLQVGFLFLRRSFL